MVPLDRRVQIPVRGRQQRAREWATACPSNLFFHGSQNLHPMAGKDRLTNAMIVERRALRCEKGLSIWDLPSPILLRKHKWCIAPQKTGKLQKRLRPQIALLFANPPEPHSQTSTHA